MNPPEKQLRLSLRQAGYDEAAINAVWPDWWSSEATLSPSAQAELRFSVARRLGLDPRYLLEGDQPVFVWKGESKFKHLRNTNDWERDALSGFGIAVCQALAEGTGESRSLDGLSPLGLRRMLIRDRPFIELADLIGLCWSLNIPLAQLRIFPAKQKRMSAMCVRTGRGFAILVGKSFKYPPHIAFYIAHELAHIALGHLGSNAALLDLGDRLESEDDGDDEEDSADRWALQLLTGHEQLEVESLTPNFNSTQLAHNVKRSGPQLGIEPGILALCCGFTTKRWPVVTASLPMIYGPPRDVWKQLNSAAAMQLDWDLLTSSATFISNALELEQ